MVKSVSFRVSSGALQLSGKRWGSGSQHLLAFHGYGQSHLAFEPFYPALPHYSIWSFDLPFHGQSSYARPGSPISLDEWRQAINTFLNQQNIKQFGIAAYSMGGKFALALIEPYASNITQLYLIAPDGIKTSLWYSMSTYPLWTRNYFQSMIHQPQPFYKLANTLHRYRLVDGGILKFAQWHMSSADKREKVYNSWTSTSNFRFRMKQIATAIKQNSIPLELFIGRYDKLMTPKGMQHLLRHLPRQAYNLHLLPVGHSGLVPAAANYLKLHASTNRLR